MTAAADAGTDAAADKATPDNVAADQPATEGAADNDAADQPATQGAADNDATAEAITLLEACTEAGRLKRAAKLAGDVDFLLAEGELIIAAVANYNVVIDVAAKRIQHGCRDFQGQAPSRRLCKHVAATVLALDVSLARRIAGELAEGAAAPRTGVVVPWSFEVITRFTPGG